MRGTVRGRAGKSTAGLEEPPSPCGGSRRYGLAVAGVSGARARDPPRTGRTASAHAVTLHGIGDDIAYRESAINPKYRVRGATTRGPRRY